MTIAARRARLCAIYDQLVPILTVLHDCEEHHIAAIISTAVDTLETRISRRQPPATSPDGTS